MWTVRGLGLRWMKGMGCAMALAVPAVPIHASPHEQQFQYAVQQYKAGRYSVAFGRFVALANRGDPDAAHFALFMNKYGPTLYGSWWDADPTEVAHWSTLVRDQQGRLQPVYVPDPYAIAKSKPAAPKSHAARR
jgi:hypothetical protein